MNHYTGLGPPPIRQPSPAVSFNPPSRDIAIAGPPSPSSIAGVQGVPDRGYATSIHWIAESANSWQPNELLKNDVK